MVRGRSIFYPVEATETKHLSQPVKSKKGHLRQRRDHPVHAKNIADIKTAIAEGFFTKEMCTSRLAKNKAEAKKCHRRRNGLHAANTANIEAASDEEENLVEVATVSDAGAHALPLVDAVS